jgi:MIP family channel proteins
LYSHLQKSVAECVGTFVLVFVGVGAACADMFVRAGSPTGLGWLGVAVAEGLAYAVMISALAHISGAHLNPAVTIGFWVTRRMSTPETLAEWLAQLAGATAAAYLLRYLIPEDVWRSAALGTPELAHDLSPAVAMLLEGVLTFFVVLVAYSTALDTHGIYNRLGGLGVGAAITMGILVGGPFTGAALNPARAFGPALVAHHWANHGVYWAGPLAGGVLASWFYDKLYLRKDTA